MAVTIDLSGQVALVTGAGAGIGAEIARWLARAGATVAVNDVREGHARDVVAGIEADGGSAAAVVANCRDDSEIERMVRSVVDRLGGLDVAVNNIGMMAGRGGGPMVTFDGAYWRELLDQNLVLTALCARAEAQVMLDQGRGGVIINVSSGETTRPSPFLGAYGAAKAGINHLTQTMAVELGPAGIRVVAIAPGIFDTPLLAGLPERVRAGLAAAVPFPKRLGRPDEYAALAELMITNGYYNGESTRLDGAIRMAPR